MNAGYMDDVEAQINFGNIAGYWQGVRMPLLVDFQLQGTEVDASAYIRNHPTTFSNRFDSSFMGQVKVVYDNGTIVCVNRNPYKKWNLTLGSSGGWYNYHALINNIDSLQTGISDSTTYLLPARNGWVVYAPQQPALMVRTNETEQVKTEEKISRIKVYPVPSQGLVYVDMPESDNVGIMATDMAGKIVYKKGFCEGGWHSDLLVLVVSQN